MNLFDLFAHEYRAKRIDQKDPLLALDELIDFQQLVDVVEAIAPRKQSDKGGRPPYRKRPTVPIICHTTVL